MTTSITPYLIDHLRAHPSMAPADVVKHCYQAAFGAEHMLTDPDRAHAYLLREWEATEPRADLPIAEPISDAVARVHLAALKARGLSAEGLFPLFIASAQVEDGGKDVFLAYLDEAEHVIEAGHAAFSLAAWKAFMTAYGEAGMPAVHHSDAYREAEHPAYRVIRRSLLSAETDNPSL